MLAHHVLADFNTIFSTAMLIADPKDFGNETSPPPRSARQEKPATGQFDNGKPIVIT